MRIAGPAGALATFAIVAVVGGLDAERRKQHRFERAGAAGYCGELFEQRGLRCNPDGRWSRRGSHPRRVDREPQRRDDERRSGAAGDSATGEFAPAEPPVRAAEAQPSPPAPQDRKVDRTSSSPSRTNPEKVSDVSDR